MATPGKKKLPSLEPTSAQLADWRIGHHIEAAGKMIADALHRIAAQMEADHAIKAAEVDLRRQHLVTVLESKATADRAAQRLMGLIPEIPSMRDWVPTPKGPDLPSDAKGPEWVQDVLEEKL